MLVNSLKTKITLLFILFILIFTVIQLKNFYFRESVVLYNFENNDKIVVNNDYYHLKGKTNSIKKLFINNKEYFLDQNNHFDINLYLFQGYNKFNIKAVSRSNSEIKRDIIIYKQ